MPRLQTAMLRAAALGRDQVVLGGERDNVALPGFDLGNSPLEYTRERVGGRWVLTTTTNGTRALLAAVGWWPGITVDPATERAVTRWRAHHRDPGRAVGAAPHARVLRAAGFGADVALACEQSVVSIVPIAAGAVVSSGAPTSPPPAARDLP